MPQSQEVVVGREIQRIFHQYLVKMEMMRETSQA
jgi:hypothetical protein